MLDTLLAFEFEPAACDPSERDACDKLLFFSNFTPPNRSIWFDRARPFSWPAMFFPEKAAGFRLKDLRNGFLSKASIFFC